MQISFYDERELSQIKQNTSHRNSNKQNNTLFVHVSIENQTNLENHVQRPNPISRKKPVPNETEKKSPERSTRGYQLDRVMPQKYVIERTRGSRARVSAGSARTALHNAGAGFRLGEGVLLDQFSRATRQLSKPARWHNGTLCNIYGRRGEREIQ